MQLGLNNKQETLRVRFEKTDLLFQDIIDQQEALFNNETLPTVADSQPTPVAPVAPFAPVEVEAPVLADPLIESKTASPEAEAETVTPDKRAVQVYLPSQTQRVFKDDDDSTFAVSLSHAQKLQDQIQRSSKSSDGPLLTKQLRQKMEDEKTENIKTIQIRIRLPDQTHLEAAFKSTETVGDVIQFVNSSLSQPDLPFRLFTNPPKHFYTEPSAMLVKTCKFSPRTLLFFEWNHESDVPKDKFPKTGIIKQEMLNGGKSIMEAPDVKLDMSEAADEGKVGGEEKKKTSWLNKGKGPLSQSQKSKLMKFIQPSKK